MNVLDVKNLKVSIKSGSDKLYPVYGVDFFIKKGESLAIIGESGCGKTVTALSIPKLLQENMAIEDSGIILDGKDIVPLTEDEMRSIRGKEIGFIFQEPMTSLNPVMKVGFQISEVLINHFDISKSDAKFEAIKIMDSVGLSGSSIYDYYPHQLSGGMRQRIVISIAIACSPKLIIADEPTTSLDVTIQKQIMKIFKELKEKGNSILFISHNLLLVKDFAHRTAIMYLGNIVEEGNTVEIFNNPLHPYTRKLVESIPGISNKKLEQIRGNVPSLQNIDRNRCLFYERCDSVIKACSLSNPPLFDLGGRRVRCFLYEKG